MIATTIMTSIRVKPALWRSDRAAVVVMRKSFSGVAARRPQVSARLRPVPTRLKPRRGRFRSTAGAARWTVSATEGGDSAGSGSTDRGAAAPLSTYSSTWRTLATRNPAADGRPHVGRPQTLLEAGTDVLRQTDAVEQDAGNDFAAVADQHLEGDPLEPEGVERVQVETPVTFRLGRQVDLAQPIEANRLDDRVEVVESRHGSNRGRARLLRHGHRDRQGRRPGSPRTISPRGHRRPRPERSAAAAPSAAATLRAAGTSERGRSVRERQAHRVDGDRACGADDQGEMAAGPASRRR